MARTKQTARKNETPVVGPVYSVGPNPPSEEEGVVTAVYHAAQQYEPARESLTDIDWSQAALLSPKELFSYYQVEQVAHMALRYCKWKSRKKDKKKSEPPEVVAPSQTTPAVDLDDDDDRPIHISSAARERLQKRERAEAEQEEEAKKPRVEPVTYRPLVLQPVQKAMRIPEGMTHDQYVADILSMGVDEGLGVQKPRDIPPIKAQDLIALEKDPKAWDVTGFTWVRNYKQLYMYVNMHAFTPWYKYYSKEATKGAMARIRNMAMEKYSVNKLGTKKVSDATGRSFELYENYCGVQYYMEDVLTSRDILELYNDVHHVLLMTTRLMELEAIEPVLEVVFYPGRFLIADVVTNILGNVFTKLRELCTSWTVTLRGELEIRSRQLNFFMALMKACEALHGRSDLASDLKRRVYKKLGTTYANNVLVIQESELSTRVANTSVLDTMDAKDLEAWIGVGQKKKTVDLEAARMLVDLTSGRNP